MTFWKARSITQSASARMAVVTMTRIAELCSLSQVGQVVFFVSSTKDSFR